MTDRGTDRRERTDEPVLLLGVSRMPGRDRPTLRGFLKALFGARRAPQQPARLPKPSRAVLASRTTSDLDSGDDGTRRPRR